MTGPQIVLERSYSPIIADVLIDIAVPRSREEFAALLQFGVECSDRAVDFTPQRVAEELLPIAPVIVSQRLLRRLWDLGLVDLVSEQDAKRKDTAFIPYYWRLPKEDEGFMLTELGIEALHDRSVFMPERKSGTITYLDDILFPDSLLSFNDEEEPLSEVIRKSRFQGEKGEISQIDDCLFHIQGTKITLRDGPEEYLGKVRIDRILPLMRNPREDSELVRFVLTIEPSNEMSIELQFKGKIHKIPISHLIKNDVTYEKVLFDLLWLYNKRSENKLYWKTEYDAASVKYDDSLSEEELKSFRKDITIKNPDLGFLGPFETMTLKHVPVYPASEQDASDWYNYLLRESITSFVTESEFKRVSNDVLERFSMWKKDIKIPTLSKLIEAEEAKRRAGSRDPVYWFLRAPLDITGAGDS